jgi:hypothetical protein
MEHTLERDSKIRKIKILLVYLKIKFLAVYIYIIFNLSLIFSNHQNEKNCRNDFITIYISIPYSPKPYIFSPNPYPPASRQNLFCPFL